MFRVMNMKEKIYTIPVNEAFDETDGCPLCAMIKKLEDARVKYMLGPAMMEPDIRIESNNNGFCKRHYEMMFAQENKLSLALILQTHIQEVNKKINSLSESVESTTPQKRGLFKKGATELRGKAARLANSVEMLTDSCIICDHIHANLERYTETLFYMWKNDAAFREKFANTNHFCLPHYSFLAKRACRNLDDDDALSFFKVLNEIQKKHLEFLKSDVDRFILKFDYRNADMPWENAKDAPKRALETLSGAEIE